MSALGILIALTGLSMLVLFVQRLMIEEYIYGWAPIVILILILSGFQMLMLGVIGEYLWRTLSQTRDRVKYNC